MNDSAVIKFADRDEDIAAVYLDDRGRVADMILNEFFTVEERNWERVDCFDDPGELAARFVAWMSISRGTKTAIVPLNYSSISNWRAHCVVEGKRPLVENLGP